MDCLEELNSLSRDILALSNLISLASDRLFNEAET
jgi:hypothetical protein